MAGAGRSPVIGLLVLGVIASFCGARIVLLQEDRGRITIQDRIKLCIYENDKLMGLLVFPMSLIATLLFPLLWAVDAVS